MNKPWKDLNSLVIHRQAQMITIQNNQPTFKAFAKMRDQKLSCIAVVDDKQIYKGIILKRTVQTVLAKM